MKEAKIKKTTDFMVGGCNVCPTVKTDIYVLELNGTEWPIEGLDAISLITAVALSSGYKQHQEYDATEDYDVYKKEKNQVTVIPKLNQLIIKKETNEEKVANTYKDNQRLFKIVNQLLTKYFDIEPLKFMFENQN